MEGREKQRRDCCEGEQRQLKKITNKDWGCWRGAADGVSAGGGDRQRGA